MAKVKAVVGDGDLLRCIIRGLIYKSPDYKAEVECPKGDIDCQQRARCKRVVLVLRGEYV